MTLHSADSIYLTEVSPKDKPWDKHKANAVVIRDNFAKGGVNRLSVRVDKCARNLEMVAITLPDSQSAIFKLKYTQFCRVRLCPICQWRKSLKWSSRLQQGLPQLLLDYPKHRWILLTLTVLNCDLEDLRVTIQKMNAAFVRLTKLKDFPGTGWIKSVEITRNSETDQAHPHFHILMMVPSSYFSSFGYLKQSDWSAMWGASMRISYNPIVDVRAVKPNGKADQGILDAIMETVKYAIKESDLKYSIEWLIELSKQLHLSRTVTLGGIFRDYFRDEKEDDNLIHVKDGTSITKEEFENLPTFDFGFNERKWKYLLREE